MKGLRSSARLKRQSLVQESGAERKRITRSSLKSGNSTSPSSCENSVSFNNASPNVDRSSKLRKSKVLENGDRRVNDFAEANGAPGLSENSGFARGVVTPGRKGGKEPEKVGLELDIGQASVDIKEGKESASLFLNGGDTGVKEEIESLDLIWNDLSSPDRKVSDKKNGLKYARDGEDIRTGDDLEKKRSCPILCLPALSDRCEMPAFSNSCPSVDGDANICRSIKKSGKGRMGRKRKNVGNRNVKDETGDDIAVNENSPSVLKEMESAQDSPQHEKSENDHVSCRESAEADLEVTENAIVETLLAGDAITGTCDKNGGYLSASNDTESAQDLSQHDKSENGHVSCTENAEADLEVTENAIAETLLAGDAISGECDKNDGMSPPALNVIKSAQDLSQNEKSEKDHVSFRKNAEANLEVTESAIAETRVVGEAIIGACDKNGGMSAHASNVIESAQVSSQHEQNENDRVSFRENAEADLEVTENDNADTLLAGDAITGACDKNDGMSPPASNVIESIQDSSQHEKRENGHVSCREYTKPDLEVTENAIAETPLAVKTITGTCDENDRISPFASNVIESAQDLSQHVKSENDHVSCRENAEADLEVTENAIAETPLAGDAITGTCDKNGGMSTPASNVIESTQDLSQHDKSENDQVSCRENAEADLEVINSAIAETTLAGDAFTDTCDKNEGLSPLASNIIESAQDSSQHEKSENDHVSCRENAEADLDVTENAIAETPLAPAITGICDKNDGVSPLASNVTKSAQDSLIFDIELATEESGLQDMECHTETEAGGHVIAKSDEGVLMPKIWKRGRKRKNMEKSECNDSGGDAIKKIKEGEPQVNGRVLRSRTSAMIVADKLFDSGLKGGVLGVKRKREMECLDQPEVEIDTNESDQLIARPDKKLKRRGRPPKVQRGTLSSTEIHKSSVRDMVSHEVKRRGRPRMVHGLGSVSKGILKNKLKNMVSNTLKRRGRPPKVQGQNLASQVIHIDRSKDKASKRNNQLNAIDIIKDPEIYKKQKKDGASMLNSDDQQKLKGSKRDDDKTLAELAVNHHDPGNVIVTKKVKVNDCNEEGEMGRRQQLQLVRDQIISIIMKAGWTIDYRPRPDRDYSDAVYVDPNGRTHWSTTKAYRMLEKKIEDGVADSKEIAAFTPIPEETFSTLYRCFSNVRSDKGKRKDGSKRVKRLPGEAPSKNKPGKKGKDESKRKDKMKFGVKLSKRSSNIKMKGGKSSREGRSKLSQAGRQCRKPRLLARSSEKGAGVNGDGFTPYNGKRSLLSWMIDSGTVLSGAKVYINGRKRKMTEGTITRDGIHCSCCNKILGISDFGSHAGAKPGQTFSNICIDPRTSLLKCMLDSWRKEEKSSYIRFNLVNVNGDDPNDDTCNICGDGGDLVCCDGCPSTFHQGCIDIQDFPSGDWHCVYCLCKFCGMVERNSPQTDDCHDTLVSELSSCGLCEEKFHQLCAQEMDAVNANSGSLTFCGPKCQQIFERIEKYIGVRQELEDGFSWTLLQRSDVSEELCVDGAALKLECNSKLAVAFAVMDECFVPIIDERSGINLIHNVVYNCGSNFRRLNFAGFFTAILERGDEMISAASIRIHGNHLAEMPFIGTRNKYRRQGMCRRLLSAIESVLGSLDIGKLIIPAIPELFQTWTLVFGFKPLEESKRQIMKCTSMVVFPGTDMLQKPLPRNEFTDGNLGPTSELIDQSNSVPESKSSSATNCDQVSPGVSGEDKEDSGFVQTKEDSSSRLNSGSPHEGSGQFSDEKNVPCQVSEVENVAPSDSKSEIQLENISNNDVHRSKSAYEQGKEGISSVLGAGFLDDCKLALSSHINNPEMDKAKVDALVKSEKLPFSLPSLDSFEPTSMASGTRKFQEFMESRAGFGKEGTIDPNPDYPTCSAVVSLELTSNIGVKNTFDLNVELPPAEMDLDSLDISFPANKPQMKSVEQPEPRLQVENAVVSLCDSEPCATQALVLV